MPDKPSSLTPPTASVTPKSCGLIMPISALDGVSAEHWTEVRGIITGAVESLQDPKFAIRLVSDADEIGIIQKRIVQNVYNSDIVVCDVSGKNPNVMFELGMRLAFDKPVVIVKDDKTDYSFDTGIIEHLTYPRDLRFNRIVAFKESLAAKLSATEKAARGKDHSPFLKNFGSFHVASLQSTEVSPEKLTLEMLEELRREVARLGRRLESPLRRPIPAERSAIDPTTKVFDYILEHLTIEQLRNPETFAAGSDFVSRMERDFARDGTFETRGQFREALAAALLIVGSPSNAANPST